MWIPLVLAHGETIALGISGLFPVAFSKVCMTFCYSCITVPVQLCHAYKICCLTALVHFRAVMKLIDLIEGLMLPT